MSSHDSMTARWATSLLLLSGCLASPATVRTLRERAAHRETVAREEALARLDAEPHPAVSELEVGADWTRVSTVKGLGSDERVFQRADGMVGFAGHACVAHDSCGACIEFASYRFVRRGSRVVVARVVPEVHTRRVEVEFCGYGCGAQREPAPEWAPATLTTLGVLDVSSLEIIDAAYDVEEIVETCARPQAAP